MSCVSPWQYEKLPARGWSYDEPDFRYDEVLFDTFIPTYNTLGGTTVWEEDTDIADIEADWEHEKLVGRGWSYDEPDFTYNSSEFDTLDPYYNTLGAISVWQSDTEKAEVEAEWTHEHRNGEGWLYNETDLTFNDSEFDNFVVRYTYLGLPTIWSYEEAIEGCVAVYLLFMNGENYQFQDGDLKELQ